nr:immunoglobulin heavy chain junction region [Macaca mulatta]MOV54217.1 immunoglobulin heavy chain junction region [Macaca mulatta]MOV54251.1 immunoglobulin heavy chain junction region [Macaca mulatta]MOV54681.1 immunoglobulin heavy chain junction region [Macaca mulatta]MOV54763.1 immunoglobulin heavy chain junction region [Macaca mulatta]
CARVLALAGQGYFFDYW